MDGLSAVNTLGKDPEVPIDNFEVYLEKMCAIAAERPLDESVIRVLKKMSALLWQRYQISRVRVTTTLFHKLNFFICFSKLHLSYKGEDELSQIRI